MFKKKRKEKKSFIDQPIIQNIKYRDAASLPLTAEHVLRHFCFCPAAPTRPSPRSRWISGEDAADVFLLKRAESCVSSTDAKQHVRHLTAAWRLSGSASKKPVPTKSSDETP